MLDIPGP